MARLHTPMTRYDENNAATWNARLQQLEDDYNATGNVQERIGAQRLTSIMVSPAVITIDLQGLRWRWLRMTVMMYTGVSASSMDTFSMLFNSDPANYVIQDMSVTGTSQNAGGQLTPGSVQLKAGTTAPSWHDLLIWPQTTGAYLIGQISGKPDAGSMYSAQIAAAWNGATALSSIQLVPSPNGFAAGSYWRIEGERVR